MLQSNAPSGIELWIDEPPPRKIKVLVADDNFIALRLLAQLLSSWGYDVLTATDGEQALAQIETGEINIALLDWMMPKLDGLEVAHRVRELQADHYVYILVLTARDGAEDIVKGLEAGADDYLTKPFNEEELHSRLRSGERILRLEQSLKKRLTELQDAMTNIKQLKGLLPICMYCKKIRDDGDYWHQIENYIHEHTEAGFTHSICPDCRERIVKPMLESLRKEKEV